MILSCILLPNINAFIMEFDCKANQPRKVGDRFSDCRLHIVELQLSTIHRMHFVLPLPCFVANNIC